MYLESEAKADRLWSAKSSLHFGLV